MGRGKRKKRGKPGVGKKEGEFTPLLRKGEEPYDSNVKEEHGRRREDGNGTK